MRFYRGVCCLKGGQGALLNSWLYFASVIESKMFKVVLQINKVK